MEFDPDKFFDELSAAIRTRKPFPEGLGTMIDWCSNHLPHDDWSKIRSLDVSGDEEAARNWIPEVLKKSPCPFEIRALYFGLAEKCSSEDEEYADLYVAFMGQYDPADQEAQWVFGKQRHYPDHASLNVTTLKSAGLIFNRENGEGLGNEGNFMFALSYTLLLTTSLMSPELYGGLGTPAERIGILAGWDSGDLMRPGELSRDGFVPNGEPMI
ncbi:MAG TPA: hypothetical protein VHD32_06040 [Candidatus Didemnitutus sp.]|nr:hypothetical protein [Candidatus Didemnitutus sp.]